MKPTLSLACAALITLGSCRLPTASTPSDPETGSADSRRLAALIDADWQFRVAENPLLASASGDNSANDQLPSVARADLDRRAAVDRDRLDALRKLDPEQLTNEERINRRILERQIWDRVESHRLGAHEIPLNVDSGFHIALARLPQETTFRTAEDYEDYCSRLLAIPTYMDQHIENMRRGLARGMTLPRIVLEGYEVTISSHVVDDPEQSLFFAPFTRIPDTVTEPERFRLVKLGKRAVREGVVPGYARFLSFMTDEYIPGCRTTLGASELPDGKEYYQQRVRYFTTLDLEPREIHELGLAEVERIRKEMLAIVKKVEFDGDLPAFLEFLRTDPRFYAKTPEELLKEASFIAKRMDAKLPTLFKKLPRLPYGVAPVPDHLAPKYTGGRFVPPPVGSTEPGYYWVNTYALESRPLYVLTALTLHEAVPGHHLQHGIAVEQDAQPEFRRYDYISAYGEGWGLYSEWLGLEAGLYEDPYDDFGRLTYEMWRACRLVVDTGLHAFGWSRQQTMDYLAAHTALSLHEIRTETDRYISWPAQALSYKIGELKIKELRRRATEELGEKFDLREFHDLILATGNVTLPILEDVVMEWVAERR